MKLDKLQLLLLSCIHLDSHRLHPTALHSLDTSGWDAFVELSLAHRLFAQVHTRLSQPDTSPFVPIATLGRLKQAKLSNAVRNIRISQQLEELLVAFEKAEVPVMVLKGAYLAEHIYAYPEQRSMSDIDLLIPPGVFPEVRALLQELGYKSPDMTGLRRGNELTFYRSNVPIDLHWNLTNCITDPPIDDAPLWERAETVLFNGLSAKVLSKEDLLLHLCMHTSYHHGFTGGLYNLLDLAVLCARVSQTLDWMAAVRRAQLWNWDRGTYICLLLAKDMLGAPIPEAVLDGLVSQSVPSVPTGFAMEFILNTGNNNLSVIQASRFDYGLMSVLRALFARLRITRQELINRYDITETTQWLIPAYYLHCLWGIAHRNYKSQLRIAFHDVQIRDQMDKATALMRFLEGKSSSADDL